jgi:hypothetical protein
MFLIDMDALLIERECIPGRGRGGVLEPESGKIELTSPLSGRPDPLPDTDRATGHGSSDRSHQHTMTALAGRAKTWDDLLQSFSHIHNMNQRRAPTVQLVC